MSLFAPVILIILRVTCPSLHCLSRRPRSCVSTVQSMWGFSTPPWGEAEKTLGVNNMSIKVLQQLGANIRICGVAKLLTNWVSLWRRGSGWNLFLCKNWCRFMIPTVTGVSKYCHKTTLLFCWQGSSTASGDSSQDMNYTWGFFLLPLNSTLQVKPNCGKYPDFIQAMSSF